MFLVKEPPRGNLHQSCADLMRIMRGYIPYPLGPVAEACQRLAQSDVASRTNLARVEETHGHRNALVLLKWFDEFLVTICRVDCARG